MRTSVAAAALTGLTVAVLTGAAVLLAAAPAGAHSVIVASTPEEGETLTSLPEAFSVTGNETLLDLGGQGAFALRIQDAAGGYYGDGCVSIVDATMSAQPALGESGDYTMIWQVVSADGHPVSGEIDFSWVAPEGFEPAPSYPNAPVCGEDPAAAPTEEPSASGDGTSIGLWIGVGVAILGGLVAALAAVAARRRRATSPGPGDSSGS